MSRRQHMVIITALIIILAGVLIGREARLMHAFERHIDRISTAVEDGQG